MTISNIQNDKGLKHLLKTMHYSLYVATHPLDGFWDLSHEKRGSIGAANIFILALVITHILKLQLTGFVFVGTPWTRVNIVMEIASILAPIALGVVSNWGLTCLFDGKGTMKDIYMAVGYCLVPYILLQLLLIPVSNILGSTESSFYYYIDTFSVIWLCVLVLCAAMMVHSFSLTKTIVSLIATFVGILIMIFVMLIFFSLISEAFAYFIALYNELVLRFY